jgi:hypothetical protein
LAENRLFIHKNPPLDAFDFLLSQFIKLLCNLADQPVGYVEHVELIKIEHLITYFIRLYQVTTPTLPPSPKAGSSTRGRVWEGAKNGISCTMYLWMSLFIEGVLRRAAFIK